MKKAAFVWIVLCMSCTANITGEAVTTDNTGGKTISQRYALPPGTVHYGWIGKKSFGQYLSELPLKPAGAKVHYHDGSIKDKKGVYDAVIDMETGTKNLQQCADAVIRLRAEYLFPLRTEKTSGIHFNFTNGFKADYDKWRQGYRIKVNGNRVDWVKSAKASDTYRDLRQYLDVVFTYAGTLSLSKELEPVPMAEMRTGDVLIQGGSPGHAVIVVNMARDTVSGKKYFMLAQSYMPAQDIQVLLNPMAPDHTVWYTLDENADRVYTPEWTFTVHDLKRFR